MMVLPLLVSLLASLGSSPAAADAGDLHPNATSAVAWLVEQTNEDGTLSSYATDPDPGLTLDAALAGMAAGAPHTTIEGWIDAAAPHARKVATDHGSMAKIVVTLAAAGRSTTEYGGINPADAVRRSITTSGYTAGHSSGTNLFGHSLAMIALARTGDLPASTVTFLTGQQCSDGGFPLNFATEAGQHCDVAEATADPDGTAMAIMALRAAEAKGHAEAEAPLDRAVAWLTAQQRASGAYSGHPVFTPGENTNSSGLAAAALSGLDDATTARIGAWAQGLQVTSGAEEGAVAYDQETFDRANGAIARVGRGQWVRATTQAVFAFAPVDLFTLAPSPERTAPYTLPGEHHLHGHRWRTSCEPSPEAERCRTDIWATTVVVEDGRFVRRDTWVFNRSVVVGAPA